MAPTSDQVDDYHGTKVADPYRPLEDPDSAPTRAWIEAENKLTFGYLEEIPARRKDSRAHERAAELRALLRPGKARAPLFLFAQQRIAESERLVLASCAGCGAEGIAGPKHTLCRWHRRCQRHGAQR